MNTIGKNLRLSIFGESHSEFIGATLDGVPSGIEIDYRFIDECLSKRRPSSSFESPRVEADSYRIISGEFNGYTTGEPLTILIMNESYNSNDYALFKDKPRPSHADYTKYVKSNGFNDYRGGGASSARLTAPIVALSSIIIKALEKKGIMVDSHIKSIGNITDRSFDENNLSNDFFILRHANFPVLSSDKAQEMENLIESYKKSNDSIGGTIETVVSGIDAGIGEPWFDSVEGKISNAMFSIPGVKGIEFGLGFGFGNASGSMAQDEFEYKDSKVTTKTNNDGGINGGISNGMPILFRVVMRPTASIPKVLNTINLKTKENDVIEIKGRHDACIVRRAVIVVKAMTALMIADLLMEKEGRDTFK